MRRRPTKLLCRAEPTPEKRSSKPSGSGASVRSIRPGVTSSSAISTPSGEKRTVSVPLHDELATGTLKSIAEQAGADDFQAFLDAIEDLL